MTDSKKYDVNVSHSHEYAFVDTYCDNIKKFIQTLSADRKTCIDSEIICNLCLKLRIYYNEIFNLLFLFSAVLNNVIVDYILEYSSCNITTTIYRYRPFLQEYYYIVINNIDINFNFACKIVQEDNQILYINYPKFRNIHSFLTNIKLDYMECNMDDINNYFDFEYNLYDFLKEILDNVHSQSNENVEIEFINKQLIRTLDVIITCDVLNVEHLSIACDMLRSFKNLKWA